jgi:hypothetical protein
VQWHRPATLLLALAACGGDATPAFRPHSAVTRDQQPLVNEAIVAYEGDAKTLVDHGGQLLGTLVVDKPARTVPAGAAHEAATVGGTHVLIVDEGSAAWALVRGEAPMPVAAPRSSLLVVRVPSLRWSDLPAGLRPRGRGVYAAGSDTKPLPVAMKWFCTSNRAGTQGTCARTADDCASAYHQLHKDDATATPCAPASAATCFSAYGPTTEPSTSCHPTIQSCSAHRDLAFVRGDSIGRECALVQ